MVLKKQATKKRTKDKGKANIKSSRVVRLPEVLDRSGLSKATIYRLMSQGSFPQSIKVGKRAVGWTEESFEGWLHGLQ